MVISWAKPPDDIANRRGSSSHKLLPSLLERPLRRSAEPVGALWRTGSVLVPDRLAVGSNEGRRDLRPDSDVAGRGAQSRRDVSLFQGLFHKNTRCFIPRRSSILAVVARSGEPSVHRLRRPLNVPPSGRRTCNVPPPSST